MKVLVLVAVVPVVVNVLVDVLGLSAYRKQTDCNSTLDLGGRLAVRTRQSIPVHD